MADPWQPDEAERAALRRLWRILKNECRGQARARAKPLLARDLAARGHAVSVRTMDFMVTWLRNRSDWPISTTGRGVFWAVTRAELLEARSYLASRFDDLATGVRACDAKLARWDARRRRALPAGDMAPASADPADPADPAGPRKQAVMEFLKG